MPSKELIESEMTLATNATFEEVGRRLIAGFCSAGFAWPLVRTFVGSTDIVPDPTTSLRICVQREKMNEVDAEP